MSVDRKETSVHGSETITGQGDTLSRLHSTMKVLSGDLRVQLHGV